MPTPVPPLSTPGWLCRPPPPHPHTPVLPAQVRVPLLTPAPAAEPASLWPSAHPESLHPLHYLAAEPQTLAAGSLIPSLPTARHPHIPDTHPGLGNTMGGRVAMGGSGPFQACSFYAPLSLKNTALLRCDSPILQFTYVKVWGFSSWQRSATSTTSLQDSSLPGKEAPVLTSSQSPHLQAVLPVLANYY